MSSKQGDSFEARIALVIANGGFIIKQQPYQVRHQGMTIGDLDVLAEDPNTGARIGVSCKEWFSSTPGSQEFSHFVEMLEHEELKHGIFASATSISETISPRIEYVKNKKGIIIMQLDYDEIRKLEAWAHSKQEWEIEDYFRSRLGLVIQKRTTIADVKRSQTSYQTGKTIEVENLIPINYWNEAPEYIRNRDFSAEESTLKVNPYLVVKYAIDVAAYHPGTGDLLKRNNDEGIIVIDAVHGKILDYGDTISSHVCEFYENAEIQSEIKETNFKVVKNIPRIEEREYVSLLKSTIAEQNEIRAKYYTAKEEERIVIKRPRADEVRILHRSIIYVPIWDVKFKLGTHSYKRLYLAYDGGIIQDEMESCGTCKRHTISICAECGGTSCEKHEKKCQSCTNILCPACAKTCIDCGRAFCSIHKPTQGCVICKFLLCENCSGVDCSVCSNMTCKEHREKCIVCPNVVCSNHVTTKKLAMITKKFCSQSCLNVFDESYKSVSAFGKLRKIIGK